MKEHHSKHHTEHETHHAMHGVKHGHREMRATGGVNEAEEDLKDKPEARTDAKKIDAEAEERNRGGKARHKRKEGGEVRVHHVDHEGKKVEKKRRERKHGGKLASHVKEVHMHGEVAKHHAGRRPRKSGGRTGSDSSPFTSARHGTAPVGHKVETEFE